MAIKNNQTSSRPLYHIKDQNSTVHNTDLVIDEIKVFTLLVSCVVLDAQGGVDDMHLLLLDNFNKTVAMPFSLRI